MATCATVSIAEVDTGNVRTPYHEVIWKIKEYFEEAMQLVTNLMERRPPTGKKARKDYELHVGR